MLVITGGRRLFRRCLAATQTTWPFDNLPFLVFVISFAII